MRPSETIGDDDAVGLALHALIWILQDDERAGRLLALTGLEPDDLRARADDPAVLGAVVAFLVAHQPDLLACAQAIGTRPELLVSAGERLSA